jgi:hypothetical protein
MATGESFPLFFLSGACADGGRVIQDFLLPRYQDVEQTNAGFASRRDYGHGSDSMEDAHERDD